MENIAVVTKQVFIGIIAAAIYGVLMWLLPKTSRVVRELGTYKLAAWTNGAILPLIPLVMLLPSTFLPDKTRVYVIVSLGCLALFLFVIMVRNQKNPCGIDMSTEKKRFESSISNAGKPFVYKISLKQSGKRVKINWATFVQGIFRLKENLQSASVDHPDIVFGINEAGIIVASYLSYSLGRPPLGIIKTGHVDRNGIRPILQFDCPNPITKKPQPGQAKVMDVLLVDCEIKSGRSAMKLQERIMDHYIKKGFEPRITFVTLGGVFQPGNNDLPRRATLTSNDFGWDITDLKYKPAFVAFYFDHPGFEAPEGLK